MQSWHREIAIIIDKTLSNNKLYVCPASLDIHKKEEKEK